MFRFKAFSASLAALIAIAIFTAPQAAAEPITGWQETGARAFKGEEAFIKAQGIASDGNRIFFSWNFGLHSTTLDYGTVLADNRFDAIPEDLKSLNGLNHIGDIDHFEGTVYAPIEDGPRYLNPFIVTYDGDTLQPTGERFELDRDLLTEGVPWVAIDAARKVAYTAEWNDTKVLNVHRLSDFAITSTVQLSREIPRIQGAKVYKGMLYAARDNGTEKSIEAIDPESGQVTNVFDRNLGTGFEAEGIAFLSNASGTTMLTSDIDKGDHTVTVHSYRVGGDTVPPAITGLRAAPAKYKRGKRIRFRLEASEAVTATATWFRCVGGKKKPCAKLAAAGTSPSLNLVPGANNISLAPRSESWAPGRRFSPGRWRLSLTPTDAADAVGPTVTAGFTVLKPKPKKKPRKKQSRR
jgi:hypothetical protein